MRHQGYDPICFEAFEDHSDWVLEESPPFLNIDEVEALRGDLANISIQPALDDIGTFFIKTSFLVVKCHYGLLF